MKVLWYKFISVLFCLTVLFSNCSNSGSKTSTEKADVGSGNVTSTEKGSANPEQIALTESILSYFQEGHFDKIVLNFDDNVKAEINEKQLAAVWERLNTHIGKYSKSEFYNVEKLNDVGDRVVYECYFGLQKLYFELIFGKENKISGISFKPK